MAKRRDDRAEYDLILKHARPGELKQIDDLGKQVASYKRMAKALQAERRAIMYRVYHRGWAREKRDKINETNATK